VTPTSGACAPRGPLTLAYLTTAKVVAASKVPSVDAVYETLRAHDVPLDRPPGERPETHYRPRQKRLLWHDPDGILLKVSEP
jgi:hypothetical protein